MRFGIFVGGRATRMQGMAKGLLLAPSGEPIVVRLVAVARELGFAPVLVGKDERYREALPDLESLADSAPNVGPLSGLLALLESTPNASVIAVACDMPYLSRELLARLADEQPSAEVLAPRSENSLWEPLCARYRSNAVLPVLDDALARGTRSFQQLFKALDVIELELDASERRQLKDWDHPSDRT